MTTPLYAAVAGLVWVAAVLAVIMGRDDDKTRPLALIFCAAAFLVQLSQHLVYSSGQYESPFYLWVIIYLAAAFACYQCKSWPARFCGHAMMIGGALCVTGTLGYVFGLSPRHIEFTVTAILGGVDAFFLAIIWSIIGKRRLASR